MKSAALQQKQASTNQVSTAAVRQQQKLSIKNNIPPHSFSGFSIQTKLAINKPGDKYEQEADAMADKVMRMPSNEILQHQKPMTGLIGRSVQRKCAHCEEDEKKKTIMRKAEYGNPGMQVSSSFASTLNASKGGGSPLPQGTRAFMENAFSTDFSQVRIHSGREATQMSKGINAKAFTHGHDVYFNEGKYSPYSLDGQRLLAHELTHVVQQSKKSLNERIHRQPWSGHEPQAVDPLNLDRQEGDISDEPYVAKKGDNIVKIARKLLMEQGIEPTRRNVYQMQLQLDQINHFNEHIQIGEEITRVKFDRDTSITMATLARWRWQNSRWVEKKAWKRIEEVRYLGSQTMLDQLMPAFEELGALTPALEIAREQLQTAVRVEEEDLLALYARFDKFEQAEARYKENLLAMYPGLEKFEQAEARYKEDLAEYERLEREDQARLARALEYKENRTWLGRRADNWKHAVESVRDSVVRPGLEIVGEGFSRLNDSADAFNRLLLGDTVVDWSYERMDEGGEYVDKKIRRGEKLLTGSETGVRDYPGTGVLYPTKWKVWLNPKNYRITKNAISGSKLIFGRPWSKLPFGRQRPKPPLHVRSSGMVADDLALDFQALKANSPGKPSPANQNKIGSKSPAANQNSIGPKSPAANDQVPKTPVQTPSKRSQGPQVSNDNSLVGRPTPSPPQGQVLQEPALLKQAAGAGNVSSQVVPPPKTSGLSPTVAMAGGKSTTAPPKVGSTETKLGSAGQGPKASADTGKYTDSSLASAASSEVSPKVGSPIVRQFSSDQPDGLIPIHLPPDQGALSTGRPLHLIDGKNRPVLAEGVVRLSKGGRTGAQKTIGEEYNLFLRKPGEKSGPIHASHLGADSMGFLGEWYNLVPLPRQVNLSDFGQIEKYVRNLAGKGQRLYIQVHARYKGDSRIPSEIIYRVFRLIDVKAPRLIEQKTFGGGRKQPKFIE